MSIFVMTVMHKELQIIIYGTLVERVRCEEIGREMNNDFDEEINHQNHFITRISPRPR